MANKDGIVSIGFDYKKELDEVCATIEKELNNLGGDINQIQKNLDIEKLIYLYPEKIQKLFWQH